MGTEDEVRLRLHLDNANALGAIEHIKSGLESIKTKIKNELGSAFGDIANRLQGMTGLKLGVGGLSDLAGGLFDAAKAGADLDKSLARTLSMRDDTGASFKQIKTEAHGLRMELTELGIKTGVIAPDVADIFSTIAEKSTRPSAGVKKLTEDLIYASRITGDASDLGRGFTNLEQGVFRARDPMVQLIRMSGMMGADTKKIVHDLQNMKVDDRMKIAEAAIERMAVKGREIEPTMGQMANSLKQVKEDLFESVGAPVMKALIPVLTDLQKWLLGHRKEIEAWAKTAGEKVGVWVKEAANIMQSAFKWIQTHAQEIKDAISFGADAIRTAIQFMLANKEAIIAMLTVRGIPGLGSGPLGLAAGAAAVAGGLAFGQYNKLQNETGAPNLAAHGIKSDNPFAAEMRQNVAAAMDFLKNQASQGRLGAGLRGELGEGAKQQFQEMLTLVQGSSVVFEQGRAGMNAFLDSIRPLNVKTEQANEALATAAVNMSLIQASMAVNTGTDAAANLYSQTMQVAQQVAGAYNTAASVGGTASQEMVATMLARSQELRIAFVMSGVEITGGMDSLIEQVQKKSAEAANEMRSVMSGQSKATGAKPPQVNVNMSGSSITVHQDFRNEDPDRVAVVFRRDIVKHSMARITARTGGIFGP